jgi:IS5 family transposase
MKSLNQYFLDKEYARVEKLGDKLTEIDPLIGKRFALLFVRCMIIAVSVVAGLILMRRVMKMLVLQVAWFVSELERQATDRLSFRKFLGFPEKIPDPRSGHSENDSQRQIRRYGIAKTT